MNGDCDKGRRGHFKTLSDGHIRIGGFLEKPHPPQVNSEGPYTTLSLYWIAASKVALSTNDRMFNFTTMFKSSSYSCNSSFKGKTLHLLSSNFVRRNSCFKINNTERCRLLILRNNALLLLLHLVTMRLSLGLLGVLCFSAALFLVSVCYAQQQQHRHPLINVSAIFNLATAPSLLWYCYMKIRYDGQTFSHSPQVKRIQGTFHYFVLNLRISTQEFDFLVMCNYIGMTVGLHRSKTKSDAGVARTVLKQ